MVAKHVIAYTDGSSLGNPGPGGYGIILRYNGHEKELSGGFRCTTNNRMELLAAIKALEALTEQCRVTLYTDSQYLVKAIEEGWARRWQRNGWMRNRKEVALNPDLWKQLLRLCEEHNVEFVWVRGHAGDPLNERCDELAKQAAEQSSLPPDPGYDPQLCEKGR
ncbi:MAG: ribonuclease HI [Anaerolineae bacterium]